MEEPAGDYNNNSHSVDDRSSITGGDPMQIDGLAAPAQHCLLFDFQTTPPKPKFVAKQEFSGEVLYKHKATTTNHFRSKVHQNFLKGVKWSPDGSCLLSSSEDNVLRVFELPASAYRYAEEDQQQETQQQQHGVLYMGAQDISSALSVNEGETIYDYAWYPMMSSADPTTCCFVSTSHSHPIHMWDAFTGELRCTYRAYDQYDEIDSPISVAFNPTGDKIYCGFNKCFRIFDVSRPGRDFTTVHTRSHINKHGQTGILSCFSFNRNGVMAIGSYSKSVGVYDEANNEELFQISYGHTGGITQVQFAPDGVLLFTGARKDNKILCWDIRNAAAPVFECDRVVNTNQRIGFDIDPTGRYLMTGSQDGSVYVYDIHQNGALVTRISANTDTINAAVFHPFLPFFATSSGERKFVLLEDDEEEEEEEMDDAGRRRDDEEPNITIWRSAYQWAMLSQASASASASMDDGYYYHYIDQHQQQGQQQQGEEELDITTTTTTADANMLSAPHPDTATTTIDATVLVKIGMVIMQEQSNSAPLENAQIAEAATAAR